MGLKGGARTPTGFPNMPEADSSSASPKAQPGKSLTSDSSPYGNPALRSPWIVRSLLD